MSVRMVHSSIATETRKITGFTSMLMLSYNLGNIAKNKNDL